MKLSKEVKTGILTIGAIVLLIFGYNFLRGKNLLNNDRTFYVIYENVEGLSTSSPVTINGMNVGKIIAINFADKAANLIVEFNIKKDFEFSKNSLTKIYGNGFIGGKSLSINPVYDKAPSAKSGDTLRGVLDSGLMEMVNNRLGPLQGKVETTVISADSTLTAINEILDKDTRRNLKSTIKDLSVTMKAFKTATFSINNLLANNQTKLNRVFDNVDQMSANLNATSATLSKTDVAGLLKNVQEVTTKFNALATNLNNGKGSAGKLLNDTALYDNLEGASLQLEQLLEDMKLHPKRYVHFSLFGKKEGSYVEPKPAVLN